MQSDCQPHDKTPLPLFCAFLCFWHSAVAWRSIPEKSGYPLYLGGAGESPRRLSDGHLRPGKPCHAFGIRPQLQAVLVQTCSGARWRGQRHITVVLRPLQVGSGEASRCKRGQREPTTARAATARTLSVSWRMIRDPEARASYCNLLPHVGYQVKCVKHGIFGTNLLPGYPRGQVF
jgi:hypothetical protein